MKFKYSARTKKGEMQVGFVDAPNKDGALGILGGNELYVLSLEPAEKEGKRMRLGFLPKVRNKDLWSSRANSPQCLRQKFLSMTH
jgi:type II secretory pathway component PulF